MEDELFDDEYMEGQPYEGCPKCGRDYNHIDFDYQICSKCGWDAENNKWEKPMKPTRADYEMGEADILTGRWF